ncbi:hypothetical protein [Paracoccus sp. DMF]|uniref:hypothetical protein n=1 Tax=Paracoccus sp. DMF TaxID=400837 RepID=UPI0021E3D941|nr:hypothetical protein [Paracoccus sp. DMF]
MTSSMLIGGFSKGEHQIAAVNISNGSRKTKGSTRAQPPMRLHSEAASSWSHLPDRAFLQHLS